MDKNFKIKYISPDLKNVKGGRTITAPVTFEKVKQIIVKPGSKK